MKAVGFKSFGGPEVLEIMEVPEVSPGLGEIRIRNYASAVNPTDIVSRSGLVAQFQKDFLLPCVPGMDIAGVVDQVGEGVETGIKIGDNVKIISGFEVYVWLLGSSNSANIVPKSE